ncbi:helix-turn-helix domain-containing protein [[Clostridium] innocuum]|nr:helix-turn-helix domain-containing protein [[Clostridium] innocuum]
MLIPNINEIVKRRKKLSLSQYGLSKKAGLPHNAISRIESGRYGNTYPIRAKAIAEALGCELTEVFKEVTK